MLSTINVTFNKKLSDASSDELRYFARQLSLFIQFILLVNKIPNKISPSKLGFTEFGCTNSEFNAWIILHQILAEFVLKFREWPQTIRVYWTFTTKKFTFNSGFRIRISNCCKVFSERTTLCGKYIWNISESPDSWEDDRSAILAGSYRERGRERWICSLIFVARLASSLTSDDQQEL